MAVLSFLFSHCEKQKGPSVLVPGRKLWSAENGRWTRGQISDRKATLTVNI